MDHGTGYGQERHIATMSCGPQATAYWRSIRVLAALLLVAAFVAASSTPRAKSLEAASPVASLCSDVIVLGLRGIADSLDTNQGMGPSSEVVANKIQSALARQGFHTVLYGVPYDKTIDLHDLNQTVGPATIVLRNVIVQVHAGCSHAKIVLVGHSEGAAILHDALGSRPEIDQLMSAAILMGDPLHFPNAGYDRQPSDHTGAGIVAGSADTIPQSTFPKVASYCLPNDWVCGNGFWLPWNGAHGSYVNDADGVASAAADFAVRRVLTDSQKIAPPPPPRGILYRSIGYGLRIHSGPGLQFPVVGAYGASGTAILVICQTLGARVAESSIWDRTPEGWVSDWYVTTPGAGTFAPGLTRC